ncbi:P-loop containing nucleoside triphosphate hydrolase protein, partial [Mycena crocata]
FGLPGFRQQQQEIIHAAVGRRDIFVLMPTGGGKSLCYQLPALYDNQNFNSSTIVISPLISLMVDQVTALRSKNIPAVMFCATPSSNESELCWMPLRMPSKSPTPALVYVTPESFQREEFQTMLQELSLQDRLARFVVDEAQCLPTWGKDFRDSYTILDRLRTDFADTPIMAVTASVDPKTASEIRERLKMCDPLIFSQSLNRQNISYTVVNKSGSETLINTLKKQYMNQTGIIYCRTTRECEKLAKKLRKAGFSVGFYHARMTLGVRQEVHNDWQRGGIDVIIAFGMGIDKANVRYVVHWNLPKDLNGYYQESGRGGRDGEPAHSILYFDQKDVQEMRNIISGEAAISSDRARLQNDALDAVVQYCENTKECRRVTLLRHFGETLAGDGCLASQACDVCRCDGDIREHDVRTEAEHILELVKVLNSSAQRVTARRCVLICMGSEQAAIKLYQPMAQFGILKTLGAVTVSLIVDKLLLRKILQEIRIPTSSRWSHNYVQVRFSYCFLEPCFYTHLPRLDRSPSSLRPVNKRLQSHWAQNQQSG